jgi:hypothetical protein
MPHRRLMMVLIYLVLLAPLFVACGSAPAASTTTNTSTAVSAPVLTDIGSPEALKARFNQDAGVPRIILLVSPT